MKTKGEVEAAICKAITQFEQEHLGRGPSEVHACVIQDLVVIRLKGVLTSAEKHLVQSQSAEKGRDLLKQVRIHLIETARPIMEALVERITGMKVISLHHDISTTTGEELILFSLANVPLFRESTRKVAAMHV